MAKDSGNTKLWIGSGLRIEEIRAVLGENTGNLGVLCKSSNINAWARYKPFRNSSKGFEPTSAGASAWTSAMTDAGFGFGSTHNNLTFGWNGNSPEWAAFYHNNGKPRGVGGGYNEPYRQLDFADLNSKGSGTGVTTNGYDETMPPPLKIDFPSELEQGGSTITVQKDGYVSGWNSSEGIAFNEVLPASLTNYNLAVLFKNGSYGNILVMGYTPATLGTNGPSTVVVNGLSIADGITLPIFDQTSSYDHKAVDGSTIKTTVALIPGRNITTGNYEILYVGSTSDTSHQSYNGDLVSLNMLGGMDSANLTYYEFNSIIGMSGILGISLSRQTSTDPSVAAFRIEGITVTLTAGPRWNTRQSVKMCFSININSYWDSSSTLTMPTGQWDYNVAQTVLNDYGSGDTTDAALTAGQQNVPVTVLTPSANEAVHRLKKPYLFAATGGPLKLTLTGYAFAGDNPSSEGTKITFTDSDNHEYLEVDLTSIT